MLSNITQTATTLNAGNVWPIVGRTIAGKTLGISVARQPENAEMQVSQDIANLLGLKKSSAIVSKASAAAAIDPNIPLADRVYLTMPLDDLLREHFKLVLDLERIKINGRHPHTDKKGDILYAFRHAPERFSDLQSLRNAFYALDYFFERFLPIIVDTCTEFPKKAQSILGAGLALSNKAIAIARAVPFDINGRARYKPQLYQTLVEILPKRDELLARAQTWSRQNDFEIATLESRRFFNDWALYSVRGAIPGKVHDPLIKDKFKRGEVIIKGGQEQMRMAMRVIPAGKIMPDLYEDMPDEIITPATFHTVYPDIGWSGSLSAVWHVHGTSEPVSVMVAIHDNQHSFSLDRGRNWFPTGAPHSPKIESMRAAAWKDFLNLISI